MKCGSEPLLARIRSTRLARLGLATLGLIFVAAVLLGRLLANLRQSGRSNLSSLFVLGRDDFVVLENC